MCAISTTSVTGITPARTRRNTRSQYEIKSDKSDHVAAHKESALTRLRGK